MNRSDGLSDWADIGCFHLWFIVINYPLNIGDGAKSNVDTGCESHEEQFTVVKSEHACRSL